MTDTDKIILTSILTGLVSATVSIIANILNLRSKTKEIKLSSYYKERIETVRQLYDLLAHTNDSVEEIFRYNVDTLNYKFYRSLLSNCKIAFDDLHKHYNKNRILLLEESKTSLKIRTGLNRLTEIETAILKEDSYLNDYEIHSNKYTNYFSLPEEEQKFVNERIEVLKSNDFVKNDLIAFKDVRKDLELYFKELTS